MEERDAPGSRASFRGPRLGGQASGPAVAAGAGEAHPGAGLGAGSPHEVDGAGLGALERILRMTADTTTTAPEPVNADPAIIESMRTVLLLEHFDVVTTHGASRRILPWRRRLLGGGWVGASGGWEGPDSAALLRTDGSPGGRRA